MISSFRASQSEIVKVFVGQKRKQYNIHKDLLCAAAPYFKKALEGDWTEARNSELHIPKDDPAAFELFLVWIYRLSMKSIDPSSPEKMSSGYNAHYNLFFLAEKWSAQMLKNHVLDSIMDADEKTCSLAGLKRIQNVYSNTPPRSNLRRYLAYKVAFVIRSLDQSSRVDYVAKYMETATNNCLDFYKDIVLLLAQSDFQSIDDLPSCYFHEHEPGKECHRIRKLRSMLVRKETSR